MSPESNPEAEQPPRLFLDRAGGRTSRAATAKAPQDMVRWANYSSMQISVANLHILA